MGQQIRKSEIEVTPGPAKVFEKRHAGIDPVGHLEFAPCEFGEIRE